MDSILFVIFILLFDNRFDLGIYNLAQCIQAFLWSCDTVVVGKLEAKQVLQIGFDIRHQQASGGHKEVLTKHGLTFLHIPIRVIQLLLIQIRKKAAVIVKHRAHRDWLHSIGVEQFSFETPPYSHCLSVSV